jgi:hypothetical protein
MRVVSFTLLPLYPRERAPSSYWIGGWVGSRVGLYTVEKRKIVHYRESNPGSSARSPSLSGQLLTCLTCWRQSELTLQHGAVGRVGDGEYMRGNFMSFDTLVSLHDFLRVDRQPFVWVHHHTEEPRVRLERKETHCKVCAQTSYHKWGISKINL